MIRSQFTERLVNTEPRRNPAPLITIFHVFANPTKSGFALPAIGRLWGAGTWLRGLLRITHFGGERRTRAGRRVPVAVALLLRSRTTRENACS